MVSTENLITLVYSKPEVWDQTNIYYSSKEKKLKAWQYISEKLNCTVTTAKVRWTNLRDLFRRELKKTVRTTKMTGDPEAYVPRWKHFKAMLFLKDQMVKDDKLELPSLAFEESMFKHYPETVLEDGEEEEGFYGEYSPSSAPTNHVDMIPPSSSQKRNAENVSNGYDHSNTVNKRQCLESNFADASENFSMVSSVYHNVDEDYHFVMSILPSIRRIHSDRKTSFKMKVLQLIMEEENYDTA